MLNRRGGGGDSAVPPTLPRSGPAAPLPRPFVSWAALPRSRSPAQYTLTPTEGFAIAMRMVALDVGERQRRCPRSRRMCPRSRRSAVKVSARSAESGNSGGCHAVLDVVPGDDMNPHDDEEQLLEALRELLTDCAARRVFVRLS